MIGSATSSQRLLAWMDALADATRLRILRLVERNELGVAELCDVLQLPQSTVSRHLKVLADQKWVRASRRGTAHLYRMILDELEQPARQLWLVAREQMRDWATLRQDELRLERLLRDKQMDSQSFFAGAAGEWDRLRGELYGQRFTTAAMLALLPPDYVVADLGCGTGQVAAELSPHVKQVIGVDHSAEMLKAARRRTAGLGNVELRRGELTDLPMEPGLCDAAMMLLVLTYVADVAAALREARRILRPGGRFVIVDLLAHDREDFRRRMGQAHAGFDTRQLRDLLASVGFESINIRPLPPEPDAQGPALLLASGCGAVKDNVP